VLFVIWCRFCCGVVFVVVWCYLLVVVVVCFGLVGDVIVMMG